MYLPIDRCDAHHTDLDNPNANLRTRERTIALLETEDPESLWYNHGIVPDLRVSHPTIHPFNGTLADLI
jgi:hypothetical protein